MVVIAAQSEWLRRSTGPANDLRERGRSRHALATVVSAHFGNPFRFPTPHIQGSSTVSRPVVCLGDSLTTGLSDTEAYPRYLQELITSPVINLGHAGITAREALKQLPDVLESQPASGRHRTWWPRLSTRLRPRPDARHSREQIIEACQNAGADVVLFEIPRGFIRDPFAGLERELAHALDVAVDSRYRHPPTRPAELDISAIKSGRDRATKLGWPASQ